MQPGDGVSKPDLAFVASKTMKPLVCTQSSNFSQGYIPLTLLKVKYSLATTEYRKYRLSTRSNYSKPKDLKKI